MLRVFVPSSRVPAVLSADVEAGAMVLEEVLPGTVAEDMPQTSLPEQWFLRPDRSAAVRAGHRRTDRPGRMAAGDAAL